MRLRQMRTNEIEEEYILYDMSKWNKRGEARLGILANGRTRETRLNIKSNEVVYHPLYYWSIHLFSAIVICQAFYASRKGILSVRHVEQLIEQHGFLYALSRIKMYIDEDWGDRPNLRELAREEP